jgi:hypothetical protein
MSLSVSLVLQTRGFSTRVHSREGGVKEIHERQDHHGSHNSGGAGATTPSAGTSIFAVQMIPFSR